jgi:4-amino-4-deoxy-L-arabinose transferase-like glycosyltransferase
MPPWSRSFAVRVGAVALAGLGLRIAFARHFGPQLTLGGDAVVYHRTANFLAGGHGFTYPVQVGAETVYRPFADHPPLYPGLLAIMSWLGGTSLEAHRIASCVIGAGTVLATGYLGRRAASERVGLIAAAIAAVHPLLVLTDSTLYSESLYGLTIALTLIAAYRYFDRPSGTRALVLGAAIGLAALTRSEALLLLPILAVPVVWRARLDPPRHGLAVALACFAVIAPWTIRSSLALDTPVLLSTNVGTMLAGANCPRTYYSHAELGLWSFSCLADDRPFDPARTSARFRRQGLRYAAHHAGRLPLVMAVRVGRVWDVYRPFQNADYGSFFEGRQHTWSRVGLWVYYVLLALGAWGAVQLRRRGRTLIVLGAPFVLVTLTAALAYGLSRFRIPADIALVVLAAVGIDALAGRARGSGRGRVTPAPSASPTR